MNTVRIHNQVYKHSDQSIHLVEQIHDNSVSRDLATGFVLARIHVLQNRNFHPYRKAPNRLYKTLNLIENKQTAV